MEREMRVEIQKSEPTIQIGDGSDLNTPEIIDIDPHFQPQEAKNKVIIPGSGIQEDGTCLHRWVIESPDGPVSNGHCKHCAEVRVFPNSNNDYLGIYNGTEVKA